MNFYIQHGYGKGQKIQDIAACGDVRGVVLSPGDEDSRTLADTAQFCHELGLRVLIDPQTYYYSTQPPGRGRQHDSHEFALPGLTWAQDAQSVARHVQRIGRLNDAVRADEWIAPGPLQDSFSDVWTPLSVQFARTASQEWGADRTFATLAVDERGLADWPVVERWLDVVTTLPVRGFYVLINRPSTAYPPAPWSPTRFTNLLRLIHALTALNEYELLWAFSDFEGLVALSAGANGAAAGWSYTLRQFSSSKWTNPAAGGRAPAVRTHLSRLWSLPRAETETALLFRSTLRDALFTPQEIQRFTRQPFDAIGRVEAQVDHLQGLAAKAAHLSSEESLAARAELTERSLSRAVELWRRVGNSGLLLDPAYGNRVASILQGLRAFTDQVDL